MNAHTIELTIAIPTYGRTRILLETLELLLPVVKPNMEVLIADQTPMIESADEARLQALHDGGRIRRLRMPRPSVMKAQNLLLAEARGEVLVYIDDDVLVPPGMFERHLAHLKDPTVAGIAGQAFHRVDQTLARPTLESPKVSTEPHFPEGTLPGDVDRFVGCNWSIRRSDLIAIGAFDENFVGPVYGWEGDIIDRLMRAGYRMVFDPDVWLVHLRVPSGGSRIPGSVHWPEWTKSYNYFRSAFGWSRRCNQSGMWFKTALRAGPLRKEIVKRPWRWPAAWFGAMRAFAGAWRTRDQLLSPFKTNNSR